MEDCNSSKSPTEIQTEINDSILEAIEQLFDEVIPSKGPETLQVLTINQIQSNSTLKVATVINNTIEINAVVDTAAQVTILSDKIFAKLTPQPPVKRKLLLQTAGRQLKLTGQVVGPLTIGIGNGEYFEDVIVAPIADEMLLGLDFMLKYGIDIKLLEAEISIGKESIPLQMENAKSQEPTISRVTVVNRTIIPPNSVRLVPCKSQLCTQFMLQPNQDLPVMIPRTLYSGTEQPSICAINISTHNVVLKRGQSVGDAHEVALVTPVNEDWDQIRQTNVTTELKQAASDKNMVPSHLHDLLSTAKKNLSHSEFTQVQDLLLQYEDVFAKDDYDLGHFTEVEHAIDTGTAKPVRQRMRRTPVCFVEEEKAVLDKMIKSKVIQPSKSEWAAAPVLIRKRDGQVRWCVDYRALNKVTVKDVYPLPLVEECMDTLSENFWFSKLDANSAYWQVKVKESDRKKTAFVTKYGLFEFIRMGFGFCAMPRQRTVES